MTNLKRVGIALLAVAAACVGCKKERTADGPMLDGGSRPWGAGSAAVSPSASASPSPSPAGDVRPPGDIEGPVAIAGQDNKMVPEELPSDAECQAAITNAFTLMVADATKAAKPAESAKLKLQMKEQFAKMKDEAMGNCMKTPKKLVLCTTAAKDMEAFVACSGERKDTHGGGKPDWSKYDGPKATKADCEGLGKHVGEVFDKDPQMAKVPDAQRVQLKASLTRVDEDCVGMPMEALKCFKNAKLLQDLSVCGQSVAPGGAGGGPGPAPGAAPGGPDPHAGHGH